MSTPEVLQRQKPEILRRWEAAVRATVPSARGESRPLLLDSIPKFLDELAEALADGSGDGPREAPRDHAEQRARLTDYSLHEVISEYGLLQITILDVLQSENAIPANDLRIILHTIQVGIAEAATHFVHISENALRESEERFRLLIESVKDYAIFMLDPDGNVTSWNRGAERIKGYSAAEAIGKHFSSFYAAEDRAAGKPDRTLQRAREDGHCSDSGWRVRKDGSRFLAHVVVTAVYDEEGELQGFAKVTRDVSELMAVDEQYRSVVNTVLDGIITIDEQSMIRTFNPAAEHIFGYSANDVLGRHISLLMPAPYRDEHDRYMENYFRTGTPKVIGIGREVVGRRKDGTTFPMELAVGEFSTSEGRFFTGIVREITQRRQLEAELRRRADELQEQNERKDEFLAVLGHELRNPLAAIRASGEILRVRGSNEPTLVRAQEVIGRHVQQLVRLVDDLLDVARLGRGRLQLQLEPVDLLAVVRQAEESVGPHLAERQQTLRADLPFESLWMKGDRARLAQAVTNVLQNASKFSPPGSVIELTVSSDGAEAAIRIVDRGAGIAPELLPHVFDLFARGVRWVNGTQAGLGIGLKLVKTLVELHGGTVTATSPGEGRGSEFTIRVPLRSAPSVVGVAKSPSPSAPGVSRRVLVVDDNADAADMLVTMLTIWGHEAEAVYDGSAAIERALAWEPNVILLDISMPQMDGYEVAQRLQPFLRTKRVTLVAVTGYGQESDKERAKEAGFHRHLTKPPDLQALERVLATDGASD